MFLSSEKKDMAWGTFILRAAMHADTKFSQRREEHEEGFYRLDISGILKAGTFLKPSRITG